MTISYLREIKKGTLTLYENIMSEQITVEDLNILSNLNIETKLCLILLFNFSVQKEFVEIESGINEKISALREKISLIDVYEEFFQFYGYKIIEGDNLIKRLLDTKNKINNTLIKDSNIPEFFETDITILKNINFLSNSKLFINILNEEILSARIPKK